ncbi:MAG: response regulator [Deltaproteobacteria bacterium]|nr:response regulator [Deltaproteobacteria bacterium]
MKRKGPLVLAIIMCGSYGAFVHFYDKHNEHQSHQTMHSHVEVIKEDVWTVGLDEAVGYLSLAASRDNYIRIQILGMSMEELLSLDGPELVGLDRLFYQIGLFPRTTLIEEIKHEGQFIGQLIVYQYNKNIYAYFYALVLWVLVFMAIMQFIKTVRQKLLVEERVKDRTVELTHEIEERKRIEEERRVLQEHLQRSEKMELIGTLAGGVAHDLNNILGAIVGYPDMMLENLDKDHPMRKQLLSIRNSGERAAAIVQDLLTLARRGVAISEPENLNELVGSYLDSREFVKLMEVHPNVGVTTHLGPQLLNIMGSAVHLTKALMNLCSNAAEAIPGGGQITISTENIYLDKSINGYDNVEEGDYVLLAVADDGVGISADEQKKVFEPFYTKKMMGNSGTGLGMAVVWGTVKDHNGYIDVESEEGRGTTFRIYLPITRREIDDKSSGLSLEKLMGSRQKILVVDDVEAQREVATHMLTTLNYEADAVSSGEEAVDYLKVNKVDLVVLDMIMSPGIDGLETFKRIVEIRPRQKAIIASGYAETNSVKVAQSIGAGEYLKKPYTIEKLGLAARNAISSMDV